jgi:uncharacterized damage-inducible protein DinB
MRIGGGMIERKYIDDVKQGYRMYKTLCDKSIAQLGDADLYWKPEPESNSIAVIMQHIGGNLRSRWRDFLQSDGEKPDRNRDAEFEERGADRHALLALWEEGWTALFTALESLQEETLSRTITIRKQPLTIMEAINRSLAHTAHHAGQIVYIAKAIRSSGWKTLSIPKGKSKEFNPA